MLHKKAEEAYKHPKTGRPGVQIWRTSAEGANLGAAQPAQVGSGSGTPRGPPPAKSLRLAAAYTSYGAADKILRRLTAAAKGSTSRYYESDITNFTSLPDVLYGRVAIWPYARSNKSNLAFFDCSWPWNFWFGLLALFWPFLASLALKTLVWP